MAALNRTDRLDDEVVTPEAIEQVIRLSERDDLQDQKQRIEREVKDIDRRISRIVTSGLP